MATIKSYTSLEQSKELAEILPIENADMEYMFLKNDNSIVSRVPFVKDGDAEPDGSYALIPCWSLAALLIILPQGTRLLKSATDERYHCDCPKGNTNKWFDNPVDACVAMIEILHELKML